MKKSSRLRTLSPEMQDYYHYLSKNVFAEFSLAEKYFQLYDYVECAKALFRCCEFFWKSLTILSGGFFEEKHEVNSSYINKIANDVLDTGKKASVLSTLTKFPESRRILAIYGYYQKGTSAVAPSKTFDKRSVEKDLADVRGLITDFRKIHYEQIFSPKVKIGVLSGYVADHDMETPCTEYTWSSFRKADEWVQDLNKIKDNSQTLIDADLVDVSNIPTSKYAIIINPFGEIFPEQGNFQGSAFSTITEYIQNGGIFVSCAGNPFDYVWDVSVKNNNFKTIVSSFAVVTGVELREEQGKPQILLKGINAIPPESLLLNRTFGVSTAWDDVDHGLQGPVDVEARYSDILKELDDGNTVRIRAFRPLKLSGSVIPLLSSRHPVWGEICPVGMVPFGRGFLLCYGMPLQNQMEYDLQLNVLKGIILYGYKRLV